MAAADKTKKGATGTTETSEDTLHFNLSRREFLGDVTTGFTVAGAACAAWPFLKSLAPSADVKAQATTEVDLSAVPEGQSKVVMWQGKPVFIKHRTPDEIAEVRANNDSPDLLDPEKDEDRVQNDKYLVAMAICTHLGCVPGEQNGQWLCPCHGSIFDYSGRVVRGPANKNLEIPPYTFTDETTIVIG